ncbi:MAG: VanZ family protein [Lachnospiraceae bacterium]|nr:VanZ family protein [Lachnospiraceae bacterium]
MWSYIYNDLYMSFRYLPLGILAAVAVILLEYTYKKMRHKPIRWDKMSYISLFVVYVIAIVQIAYFSREPGSRSSIDLGLLDTWGQDPMSRSFVIENVIMFIPFGMLVPAVWDKMRAFHRCLLAAFISTVAIETMQLITQRGYCQLDDVVMNTLGGAIGYGIFYLFHKVAKYMHNNF